MTESKKPCRLGRNPSHPLQRRTGRLALALHPIPLKVPLFESWALNLHEVTFANGWSNPTAALLTVCGAWSRMRRLSSCG